ncbi:MAG: SDR family oxidoreductase [Lysobacterales bacterium]|jgi:3-oxoacyl-[acyl-carrier protein] reductase
MSLDLRDTTALVTGAARGIGLVLAEDLARAGVKVCGTDIRAEALHDEMQRIGRQHGVDTLAVAADVGDEDAVAAMVSRVFAQWGRVDILINNAGVREVAPVYDTSAAAWDRIHASNLRGQYLCTREVLRQGMLRQNEGTIIFISSGSGKRGERGSSAYCASKFGVTGLSESVAKDLKETRIRVTSIMPGMVWTPMAEESEMADKDVEWLDPRHVSNAVLFCIRQDPDTIIPELQIYHRFQL